MTSPVGGTLVRLRGVDRLRWLLAISSRDTWCVAASGFTQGFHTTLATKRESGHLVVPIDRSDLQALVEAPNRSELLKSLHQRTIEISAAEP